MALPPEPIGDELDGSIVLAIVLVTGLVAIAMFFGLRLVIPDAGIAPPVQFNLECK